MKANTGMKEFYRRIGRCSCR